MPRWSAVRNCQNYHILSSVTLFSIDQSRKNLEAHVSTGLDWFASSQPSNFLSFLLTHFYLTVQNVLPLHYQQTILV